MFARKMTALALTAALLACADRSNNEEMAADTASNVPADAPATDASAGTMLDPNTASAQELAAIPGLNDSLANAIIAARPFADMRAVNSVLSGLSEAQRDSVYTRLWKPIDLNTASAEEIELIPGVGPRMRHEFEEYRPYTSMDQFRREIGKYVDAAEVARLERYVSIPNAQ